jgi:hypothetical protein
MGFIEDGKVMKTRKLESNFINFESMLGEEFTAHSGDLLVRFKLIEASKLPRPEDQARIAVQEDPFSLLFKEITNIRPEQGIFTVDHDKGTVDLFLVAVGTGEYEAIFN